MQATPTERSTDMDATMTRLNSMTVAQLRIIGREMGIAGLSGLRKAELVTALTVFINGQHIDALKMNNPHPRTIVREGKVSPFDYPAVEYRTVTQAHADICDSKGHATYVKDGVDMGFCPRCGEFTPAMIAKALEQEKALAEVEPFESPIALCGDSEESVSAEIVIAPAEIQIPAMVSEHGYTAHGDTYAVDYNRIHEAMAAKAAIEMSHSDPIDDVIRFAREAIDALLPNLAATKSAFETLRDDESASPAHVDLAYQVYSDTYRAIEEYKRTIAYAENA